MVQIAGQQGDRYGRLAKYPLFVMGVDLAPGVGLLECGTGQGSILFRILLDETLREHLTATTYYYDKVTEKDFEKDPVTEDLYESYFEGSYLWTGMETLPKGHYNITSWATIMPDFKAPGDEQVKSCESIPVFDL